MRTWTSSDPEIGLITDFAIVGGTTVVNTWICSALSCVFKALTNYEANDPAVSDNLANAAKALTLYFQAADAYFTQNNA